MPRYDLTFLVLSVSAAALPAAAQETTTSTARALPSHPVEVALIDEGERGTVYRRFPTGERLYTYDLDTSAKSNCNYGCSSAWPPVVAPADAAPVGEWTIIRREDGKRQWALKGKPVYTRFHDAPDQPTGDGHGGVWRVIPHSRASTNPSP